MAEAHLASSLRGGHPSSNACSCLYMGLALEQWVKIRKYEPTSVMGVRRSLPPLSSTQKLLVG